MLDSQNYPQIMSLELLNRPCRSSKRCVTLSPELLCCLLLKYLRPETKTWYQHFYSTSHNTVIRFQNRMECWFLYIRAKLILCNVWRTTTMFLFIQNLRIWKKVFLCGNLRPLLVHMTCRGYRFCNQIDSDHGATKHQSFCVTLLYLLTNDTIFRDNKRTNGRHGFICTHADVHQMDWPDTCFSCVKLVNTF